MNNWYQIRTSLYTDRCISECSLRNRLHQRMRATLKPNDESRWIDLQFKHFSSGGKRCYDHTIMLRNSCESSAKQEASTLYNIDMIAKSYCRSVKIASTKEMYMYDVHASFTLNTFEYNHAETLRDYLKDYVDCASGLEGDLDGWGIEHDDSSWRRWRLNVHILAESRSQARALVRLVFYQDIMIQFVVPFVGQIGTQPSEYRPKAWPNGPVWEEIQKPKECLIYITPKYAEAILKSAEPLNTKDLLEAINMALNIDLDLIQFNKPALMQFLALIVSKRLGTDDDIFAIKEAIASKSSLCENTVYDLHTGMIRIEELCDVNNHIRCTMLYESRYEVGLTFPNEEAFHAFLEQQGCDGAYGVAKGEW